MPDIFKIKQKAMLRNAVLSPAPVTHRNVLQYPLPPNLALLNT